MKGKLTLGIGIVLIAGAVIVMVLRRDDSQGRNEANQTATKSDFAQGETVPGFGARRSKSDANYSQKDFEPLTPLLELEPVVIREGDRVDDLSPEQLALLEEQQRQIGLLIADQNSRKFELRLGDLVKGLNLSPEQEGELRAHFALVQGEIEGGDLQAYGRLQALLDGEGVEALLEELLDSEQLARHREAQERARLEAVEEEVAVELNFLSNALTLTKDQHLQVADALREQALAPQPSRSAEGDLAEAMRLGRELRAELDTGEAGTFSLTELIEGRQAQAREARLAPLKGILTAEQLARYRTSLELNEAGVEKFLKSVEAFGGR